MVARSKIRRQKREISIRQTILDLKRTYAETFYDRWLILSAEHGFIPPWKEIEPYETHIDDREWDRFIEELAHGTFTSLKSPFVTLHHKSDVEVLAGKKYCNAVLEAARIEDEIMDELNSSQDRIAPKLSFPFQEADLGGIGEQMNWLKTAIEDHLRRPPESEYKSQISLSRYSDVLG